MAAVTAQSVAAFLDQGDDPQTVALAGEALPIVTAIVRSYVRGNGFDNGEYGDDIAAVITTATARVISNPSQLSNSVGTVSVQGGFTGFTFAEMYVLNGYRTRAV